MARAWMGVNSHLFSVGPLSPPRSFHIASFALCGSFCIAQWPCHLPEHASAQPGKQTLLESQLTLEYVSKNIDAQRVSFLVKEQKLSSGSIGVCIRAKT